MPRAPSPHQTVRPTADPDPAPLGHEKQHPPRSLLHLPPTEWWLRAPDFGDIHIHQHRRRYTQPVGGRAPMTTSGPRTARSLLTRVATFRSGRRGRSTSHNASTIWSTPTSRPREPPTALTTVCLGATQPRYKFRQSGNRYTERPGTTDRHRVHTAIPMAPGDRPAHQSGRVMTRSPCC